MASLVLGAVATGAAPNPVPSAAQLAWTQHELGIMVSYDMITQLTDVPNPQHFCIGAGGDKNLTVPPASAFNPTDLAAAPAQWMDVAESFGAKYAVYVAMHCSGFAQWPSKIYNYSLAQTALADQDPLAAYFEAAKQRGISPGLYVTWNYNALFNVGEPGGRVQPGPLGPGQRSVTQAEYHDIALEVLSEVYTQYEGRVGEVWFDGGESDPGVSSLMQSTQPQAVYMQGQADDNNARIDGLESGFLSQPVWSRGTAGKNNGGSPLGAHFVPVESDTPISEKDAWFWKPGQRYRPLQELQSVYVNSVGANANLLLGVMPNATGLIGQDQVDLLAQFGAWVKRCYGPGTAAASAGPSVGPSVTLELPTGTVIDRIIVQEDQSAGEQVASFSVEVSPPGGYKTEWIAAGSGESIGHKRIFFLPSGPIAATAVRITVTSTLDGAPAPAQAGQLKRRTRRADRRAEAVMAEVVTKRRGHKADERGERVHSAGDSPRAASPAAAEAQHSSEHVSELWFGLPEWPTMHLLFLFLGFVTRFYRLADPAAVVFDEHHFGRFTNQYTKGTYLFDIHPPLGKLVFWLVAQLVGYDPEACDYSTIHTKYTEHCNYMPLRVTAAAFGCVTVPLIYSICRRFGCRVVASSLAALLFLTDNLNLIESRLILVDSQLIFFATLSLWVALIYWERRRQHEDALLLQGRGDIRPVTEPRDVARTGNSVVDADDVINRGYGSLGVWVPPPFAFLARPGRNTLEDDSIEMTERQNPVAVEAAAHGIGRMRAQRSQRPRILSLSERIAWSVGLGLVCGCAVSVKWTNLATPGMIAIESFFGLFFLREPADIVDLLVMGASALSIYTFWFWCHFALLPVSGDGDGFMRVEFQRTLPGNSNYDENARKPFFLSTFTQLNQEMLSANARIDTPHHWMSKWWTWPINARGVLYYSSDVEDDKQQLIYLLGNPAAIWLVLAGVLTGFVVLFMYCRCRAGHDAFFPNWVRAFAATLAYTCIIWLLNLLPYILVSRAAFVYHYMPALLYAELATAIVVDKLSGKYLNTVAQVLGGVVLAVWLMFSPWVYGIPMSKDYHASLRWMKGWD